MVPGTQTPIYLLHLSQGVAMQGHPTTFAFQTKFKGKKKSKRSGEYETDSLSAHRSCHCAHLAWASTRQMAKASCQEDWETEPQAQLKTDGSREEEMDVEGQRVLYGQKKKSFCASTLI